MDMNDASMQELIEEVLKRVEHTNGLEFVWDSTLRELDSAIRDEESIRHGGNPRE